MTPAAQRSSWLSHALKPTRWQPQRQLLALGTLALFVGVIIGALYLTQSSAASTLGRQLEDLISQRNRLELENEQLRAEIANLQRVGRLLTRAEELGFVPATESDLEYLVVSGYNPDRARTQINVNPAAGVYSSTAPPVTQYDESFAGWMQQQIDALRGQLDSFVQQSQPTLTPSPVPGG